MKNQEKILTINDAYDAMCDFLEKQYEISKSEDIASLLSDLSLLQDEKSFDPAMTQDWIASANKILSQNPRERPYLVLTKEPLKQ